MKMRGIKGRMICFIRKKRSKINFMKTPGEEIEIVVVHEIWSIQNSEGSGGDVMLQIQR